MRFEFDPRKQAANVAKHGLDFSIALAVFDDPLAVEIPDRVEAGEQRWHVIGVVANVTLVVVIAYPDRADETRIRIISVREATGRERRSYEDSDPL